MKSKSIKFVFALARYYVIFMSHHVVHFNVSDWTYRWCILYLTTKFKILEVSIHSGSIMTEKSFTYPSPDDNKRFNARVTEGRTHGDKLFPHCLIFSSKKLENGDK